MRLAVHPAAAPAHRRFQGFSGLELGKGFLFEARQKRFTFDDEHFFVDLVFYNRLLRCYVLIALKLGKLTHQELGQMQMYVNYFDRHVKTDRASDDAHRQMVPTYLQLDLSPQQAAARLGLKSVDAWQGNTTHDTRAPWEGKGVLVSLTLERALSDLVGHKISINSLFLDEGFDTLELALLGAGHPQRQHPDDGPHQRHVETLKECIPAQTRIIIGGGLGHSRLGYREIPYSNNSGAHSSHASSVLLSRSLNRTNHTRFGDASQSLHPRLPQTLCKPEPALRWSGQAP